MSTDDFQDAQNMWKAQNQEQQSARIRVEPENLAAMARTRERLNQFMRWSSVIVMILLAAGALYNVYTVDRPWIRIGEAWLFVWLAYVLGRELQHGAGRKNSNEPCARFLERQHEERASGYLRMRRRLWF